ncbi:MAG: primosomal protein N' [Phycisphaerales bacterium]|nr:MAG: primosomal protein N' [Phycisphaerales bacterium]
MVDDTLFPRAPVEAVAYAHVVLERSMDYPDGLTYAVPASMRDLRVGERVEAPLGRADHAVQGYVVEIVARSDFDPARIKPIRKRTGITLPGPLVELAQWMARYYCCPLGTVLGAVVPAPVKRGVGNVVRRVVERTGEPPEGELPPATRDAWARIEAMPADAPALEAKALAKSLGLTSVAPINRLVKLGVLRIAEVRSVRAVWAEHAVEPDKGLTLSEEQRIAFERIARSLDGFSAHLLRGVTGSGKTEVYLRVLDKVIETGAGAIVLVPEISLTPQTAGRFLGRFGQAGVAVLHSGLTAAQRHQQWARIATGEARIVVGARSAIFAPFPARVGLIIVDEEHDEGYKQDQAPRYHGRDVAIKRAQIEGCPVVLGSATPSLESWRNATQGRFVLSELSERVGGARLPRVQVVDLAEERRARPWSDQRVHLLGPRLESAIGRTLAAGGQIILLLNRRGFANYICCPDHRCGWTLRCDECDATMVYHLDKLSPAGGVVRCHHCLAEVKLPAECPLCARRVSVFGLGTQRVEQELSRVFPELIEGETLLRVDGDTMRTGRDWLRTLDRFGRGEVLCMIGTQMIAKGLDYPNVRLVGVINADTALNLPDFRAAERTFQLVSQVAGRSGRGAEPGRVVVQTMAPESPAIALAATHDYRAFAQQEMEMREQAGLPPFARMARVVVRDQDYAKALRSAREIAHAMQTEGAPIRVRGPMPCPLSRIAGFHRIAIEMTADKASDLQRALTSARNTGLLKSDARTSVDVDPTALL